MLADDYSEYKTHQSKHILNLLIEGIVGIFPMDFYLYTAFQCKLRPM